MTNPTRNTSETNRKPRATHRRASLLAAARRNTVVSRMSAYVRGEQSPDAKRETARLIDRDDSVHAEFTHAARTDSALRADLAPHGRPERAQLDRAFANIGAALNGHAPLYRLHIGRPSGWRASVAAFMMAALLLLPLGASFNRVAAIGIPTQPEPRAAADEAMTATGDVAIAQDDTPNQTVTPALATAQLVTRATPTAPEKE
jgi:anti-sigma factor RsiW